MDTMPTADTLHAFLGFTPDAADRVTARRYFRDSANRARYWLTRPRGTRPEMAARCYREMVSAWAMFHG